MADINKTIVGTVKMDTGDAAKGLTDVKKGLKDVAKEQKDVNGGNFDKLKDNLTSISPAANKASEGINLLKGGLDILKAHPIIAVITVLVGLVTALFQPFKKMEAVADSLGKVWGTLSGVFDTFLNKILTPLIDGFVKITELFSTGLITVLDAIGVTSKETADRFGEITEALDDLEDAEKDAAIATAASNRKLQEAREIAGDANVPIKERIAALKEAGKIEKEELDKVVKMNQLKAQLTMEAIAIELGARDGLIAKIKEGSLESLKAARAELASMKNVDKEKLYAIDAQIIAAENAAAQSSKIGKKTQSQITSLEKEEESKREAARKEAAQKAKEQRQKEIDARIQQEQEYQRKLKEVVVAGEKAIQDALKVLRVANRQTELSELNAKYQSDLAAAQAAGFSTLKITEAFQKQRDEINKKFDEQDKATKDANDKAAEEKTLSNQQKVLTGLTNYYAQDFALKEQATKDKIALDAVLLEQQRAMQEQVNGLLQNASAVFGQQTAVGKGIAIAQALINTYTGATDALRAKSTLPSPFDVVAKVANVAAVLATGFKSIKAITSVQVPNAGAGSGGAPSIPAPVTPQQTSTQLNAASIQGIGNAAAGGVNRSFVLESDINNNDERQRRLNRAARLN